MGGLPRASNDISKFVVVSGRGAPCVSNRTLSGISFSGRPPAFADDKAPRDNTKKIKAVIFILLDQKEKPASLAGFEPSLINKQLIKFSDLRRVFFVKFWYAHIF